MLSLAKPYLLYVGNAKNYSDAKTASAIFTWSKDDAKGYYALDNAKVKFDLPIITPENAVDTGIKSLVIGFANSGGYLIEEDKKVIVRALKNGLNIISGMHVRLETYPEILAAKESSQKEIFNVRFFDGTLSTGTGEKRLGKRVLTVGTDCNVGKMFATLALANQCSQRSIANKFVATGQTGIIIAGNGIAIDAVVSDFVAGASELLSPSIKDNFYYFIEGQGSLHHPSFAGVSLGLLHGSQPDYLILCHDPYRNKMRHADYPISSIKETMELNLKHAKLTNQNAEFKGIILNLSKAPSLAEKNKVINEYENKYKLPVADIFFKSVDNILDNILK